MYALKDGDEKTEKKNEAEDDVDGLADRNDPTSRNALVLVVGILVAADR